MSVADGALAKMAAARRIGLARAREYPAMLYEPHAVATHPRACRPGKPSGQLQFHEATQPVRLASPGNGWGGTMACGVEVDAWVRHTCRWQPTPEPPILSIWFCPKMAQFDALRLRLLEPKVFGRRARWRTDSIGNFFEWPNGSRMYVGSYNTSWTQFEGIEPDLVVFDEQPPPALWREMQQRRRGQGIRKCRFIGKATQTKGWSWMADTIYEEWLAYHRERGLTESEAMDAQLHPYYWVWPMGGIHDNPHVDEETVVEYEERSWPSEKERKVRLRGGFESFHGDAVFDEEAVAWFADQQERWDETLGAGRHGFFVPAGDV